MIKTEWELKAESYLEEAKGEYVRGPYVIKLEPKTMLYTVSRQDAGQVPPELEGHFTTVKFVENIIDMLTLRV